MIPLEKFLRTHIPQNIRNEKTKTVKQFIFLQLLILHKCTNVHSDKFYFDLAIITRRYFEWD